MNYEKQLKLQLKNLIENEILAPYTTFKIGGPAKFFYVAKNNDEVIKAITLARELNLNYFILGNGSNILISDAGFNGLVVKMENQNVEIKQNKVKAESGVKVQKLIRDCIAKNLSGLEFLIGIPGTVGGGVAGNIGTTNEWIGHKINSVEILNTNNEVESIPSSQCSFSYRYSRFKNNDNEIILTTDFTLNESSQNIIQKNVKTYLDNKSHQPASKPCAGSIFKNPKQEKCWQLIDKVGLRGKRIGGAQVSNEHANFIINNGSATAEDVTILISLIKQQVRDKLGVQLQEEIKYIGF